jgi:hypothetical protein
VIRIPHVSLLGSIFRSSNGYPWVKCKIRPRPTVLRISKSVNQWAKIWTKPTTHIPKICGYPLPSLLSAIVIRSSVLWVMHAVVFYLGVSSKSRVISHCIFLCEETNGLRLIFFVHIILSKLLIYNSFILPLLSWYLKHTQKAWEKPLKTKRILFHSI